MPHEHARHADTECGSAANRPAPADPGAAAPAELGRAGHEPAGRAPAVRAPAQQAAAQPEGDFARLPRAGAAGGGIVRGLGRRRQGRDHPAHGVAARSARLQGVGDRGADPGRAGPPLPLPLLAAAALPRAMGGVRPLVVRPRAGGADRGVRDRGRVAPRLRRDQRVRARAGRRRHPPGQDLPAHHAGRAAQAVPGPSGRSAQAAGSCRKKTCATAPAGPNTKPRSTRCSATPRPSPTRGT